MKTERRFQNVGQIITACAALLKKGWEVKKIKTKIRFRSPGGRFYCIVIVRLRRSTVIVSVALLIWRSSKRPPTHSIYAGVWRGKSLMLRTALFLGGFLGGMGTVKKSNCRKLAYLRSRHSTFHLIEAGPRLSPTTLLKSLPSRLPDCTGAII